MHKNSAASSKSDAPGAAAGRSERDNHGEARWFIGLAAAVFVLSAAPFLGALSAGFTNWDDPNNITENLAFRGLTGDHLRWIWTTEHLGVYEPLGWTLKAVIFLACGLNATAFHGVSIVLHAFNALFVYEIARRLLRRTLPRATLRQQAIGAAVAALAFGMHPVRAEVVVWPSGQPYALAAFFSLLAALVYVVTFDADVVTRRRHVLGLSVCTICYACGMLSKTAAMPLVAVLMLLDVYPLRRFGEPAAGATPGRLRRMTMLTLEKLPLLVSAVVIAVVAARIDASGQIPARDVGLGSRAQIAGNGVFFCVTKSLWPAGLSPFYALPLPFKGLPTGFAVATVVAVLLTLGALLSMRRLPSLATAWLAMLLWFAPASGLVRHGDQYTADRYTYLSCIGLAMLLGGATILLMRSASRPLRIATIASLCAALSAAAGLAIRQTWLWSDSERLWRHALALDSDNWVAYNNLANCLLDGGQTDSATQITTAAIRRWPAYHDLLITMGLCHERRERFQDAAAWYERALKLNPRSDCVSNLASAYKHLGRTDDAVNVLKASAAKRPDDLRLLANLTNILIDAGRAAEAEPFLRHCLELRPRDAGVHCRLGIALIARHDFAEAEMSLRQALAFDAKYPKAQYHLAYVLSASGRRDEAIAAYEAAILADPAHVESRLERGALLVEVGRDSEAVAQWTEALKLAPGNAAAMNSLAWTLATSRAAAVRDGHEAVRLAEQVARLTRRANPQALLTLSAALAEVGRFDEAIQSAREARERSREREPALAPKIEAALAEYQAGRPIRSGHAK